MTCSRYTLRLRAVDAVRLPPFKGSALRGGLGRALKRAACMVKGVECLDCAFRATCPYAYLFETPPPPDAAMLRLYRSVPHPFVLEPPDDGITYYEPGRTFEAGAVLVGRAVDYLPWFVRAFVGFGRAGAGRGRGRFTVEAVCDGSDGKVVYDGVSERFGATAGVLRPARGATLPIRPGGGLRLRLLTPLRIVHGGSLVSDLAFHHLVRTLLRRLSALAWFHCAVRLELDFRGLIERASAVERAHADLRWHDWERYSSRQKTRMRLGGLVGTVVFRGVDAGFAPILRLGEALHAGKGATFGLGRYVLEGE